MSTSAPQASLSGTATVVTGAGSGIGRATCVALAAEGGSVIAADVDAHALERTLELIPPCGAFRPVAVVCDVRREADVDRLVVTAMQATGGRLDALVACAGMLRPRGERPKPLVDVSPEEWDAVVDTNLRGTFLCSRAVLKPMIAQRRGHIVNLSSTSGRQGRALDAPYCASKFGVIGLSEAMAEEVRPYGVRVHVLLPDAVATPMWDQNGPIAAPADALPPARIAEFILYLLRLPEDTVLVNPVIAPFRTRRRTPRPVAATAAVEP